MEIAQEIEKTYKEVKMKGHLFEKKERFSIRKFSVGVCSALIGLAFLGTGAVSADETVSTSEQPLETSSVATEEVNHLVREAGVYTADAALPTADPAKPATEAATQRLALQVQKLARRLQIIQLFQRLKNRKLLLKKWLIYQPMKKNN